MAKRIVLRLLDEYLGQYVKGIDKKDLEVSLLRGRVRAANLTLRPEAFDKLQLPLTIAAGYIGSLSLDVPWTSLMSEPVVLTLERVFIVLRATAGVDADAGSDANVARVRDELLRMKRVHLAIGSQLQQLRAASAAEGLETASEHDGGGVGATGRPASPVGSARSTTESTRSRSSASAHGSSGEGGSSGGAAAAPPTSLSASLLARIKDQLQIVVKDVHIRYEDDRSYAPMRSSLGLQLRRASDGGLLRRRFAVGVTLRELAVATVAVSPGDAVAGASAERALRRRVAVERLSVYWDCECGPSRRYTRFFWKYLSLYN